MMGESADNLREFFAAGVEMLVGTLAPGKGSWVSVLQGTWTMAQAQEAANGLTIPLGFYLELGQDGKPDVWMRDLAQGKFYAVMLRREPARVTEGS